MTIKLDVKLTDVFEPNTLVGVKRANQGPMASGGKRFFVWESLYSTGEATTRLKAILSRGEKFVAGANGYSISNYIQVKDEMLEHYNIHCMEHGPNSNSSHKTVRIEEMVDNSIAVRLEGWGMSHVLAWRGSCEELLNYFEEYQKEV